MGLLKVSILKLYSVFCVTSNKLPLTCGQKYARSKKSKNVLAFFSLILSPLTFGQGRLHLENKNKYRFILYFARFALPLYPTPVSPQGQGGHILLEKDVYGTLSSSYESRKFKCRKKRNGASALGVLYPACLSWYAVLQYLTAWAHSSCLSLHKAMREPV